MRIAEQYHYLIAGLPEISLEDAQYEKSLLAFKDLLKEQIQPGEYELLKQLFLTYDHKNLISFFFDELFSIYRYRMKRIIIYFRTFYNWNVFIQ